MSQYLQIYVKDSADKFLELLCFSRNTEMYKVFSSYVPYGKVRRLTDSLLKAIWDETFKYENDYKKHMEKISSIIHEVQMSNNPLHEKVDCIDNYLEDYTFTKELVEQTKDVRVTIDLLTAMQVNNAMYAGIEAGDNPEVD